MTEKELKYWFDTESEKLFWLAYPYLKDCDLCDDVVQEAFIALWKTEEHPKPGAFLHTTVTNKCIDVVRRLKRKRNADIEIKNQYDEESPEESMENKIVKAEIILQIKEEIKKLPPVRRKIMEMFWFQGMTYEEICIELRININSVRVQIKRGVDFLKKVGKRDFPEMMCNAKESESTKRNKVKRWQFVSGQKRRLKQKFITETQLSSSLFL